MPTTIEPNVHTKTIDELNRRYEEFLETGVYYTFEDRIANEPAPWRTQSPIKRNSGVEHGHMKLVAKELGRPFVVARGSLIWARRYPTCGTVGPLEQFPQYYMALSIPRRKYLHVLATTLLLVAEPNEYKKPVYEMTHFSKSQWNFRFSGDEGRKIFEHWRNEYLKRPECRAALKLPPLTEEVTHVARRAA